MKNKINHQNDVICFGKNIEDSIKDGLIISIGVIRIFFGLKAANVKPPKASLDTMNIMKLADGIYGELLMKDYAVCRKWIKESYYKKNFMTLVVTLVVS